MRFDAPSLERIRRGALLHDIGKIGISSEILDSPAPLTVDQMAIVREHPALGARILEPVPHCADILPMVLQHHERFDGGGYPAGLAGTGIALDARILAVADVYDAMISDRPYRRGLPSRDAAVRISEAAGGQFDPEVVSAFAEAFRNAASRPARRKRDCRKARRPWPLGLRVGLVGRRRVGGCSLGGLRLGGGGTHRGEALEVLDHVRAAVDGGRARAASRRPRPPRSRRLPAPAAGRPAGGPPRPPA
jgi:hypothetical protein